MKRKSNITVWQLHLFESLDRDIMVMHRDEEEVFDHALHVFFDKEYYDAYLNKAQKYSEHRYTYHEDKLGEAIYQIFEEKIEGLVLHISTMDHDNKSTLCEEKYLSAEDLRLVADAVDSYHHLYTVSIERMSREEAIARLWTKNVYIIGKLPDFTKRDEKQTVELMTMRRKKDGSVGTQDDYDYESVKIFLTPESAMHFNPEKKPINRYKLSMLAGFVKGKFQLVIEPHRNYWLEFDPANLELSEYLKLPKWDEEKVIARIEEFTKLEKLYILLAPLHSDYRTCVGTPFLVKLQEDNVMMYVFEEYEDAAKYVLENAAILPVLDGTYPIGILSKEDKLLNLETVLAIANHMGVHHLNLDMDTDHALGCKISYFLEKAGFETEVEKLLSAEDYEELKQEKEDGKKTYRFPAIPFADKENPYDISEERKTELISHIDSDYDQGITYMAGLTLPEMMVMLREAGRRFDEARTKEDEEGKKVYNRLMNQMTIPLTESLLEKPYIYTLRNEDGSFTLKNNLPYLLVTNRFEAARKGEGKLAMCGIDNENFLTKVEETSRIAILTDGPNCLCFVDLHLMAEVVKQKKKAEALQEEIMIYLTQGLQLSYEQAVYYYKRLKSDNGIFVEFISCVRNGEYSPMGLITVAGQTAKSIADEKGLNPLQAYDALLTLKENPKAEIKAAAKEETQGQETADTTKQKSFFGKLFGKDK